MKLFWYLFFDIAVSPHFNRREVEEKYVEEGADVELDCTADGQPYPQFRWIKDGTTLRNGRKYLVEGSVLTIRRAINSDEGLYECFAENTLGFARHSIKLIVRGNAYLNSVAVIKIIKETIKTSENVKNDIFSYKFKLQQSLRANWFFPGFLFLVVKSCKCVCNYYTNVLVF